MALKRVAKTKPQPTLRTFMPLIVAAGFGLLLLIVLVTFVLNRPAPEGLSQQELAADYAKGLQYERGDGVVADPVQAQTWYRKAAEGGYPQAELGLGILYMSGRGVVKDETEAAKWFGRAAEHGLPEAQVQLAGDYLTGTGIAMDKVEALKWLLLGAEAMPDDLGKAVARKTRDSLADSLTAEQRAEAGQRAEAWRKLHQPE